VAGRIVLFGATGYTGRLVAQALVDRGARPVLAGRNPETLGEMAEELGGGLETQAADVARPETVRELVEQGDVLVSTVGPFTEMGAPAADAAVDAGAHYIDSTGEPPFIRRIFEEWGPRAKSKGAGMLTAFGYDYVPGNLAGALALEQAGDAASKVAVGYFISGAGSLKNAGSGGTMASTAGMVAEPGFAFRAGKIVTERPAKRVRSFQVGGKSLTGMSVGMTEHYTLPRVHPQLREVDAYLGWFGPASRALQALSLAGEIPGSRRAFGAVFGRFVKGSTGGPDAEARAKTSSKFVAEASDPDGNVLAHVEMRAPNWYTLTGDVIAWGAAHAAEHGLEGAGALGPVDGFGLRTLEAGCAEVGLTRAG
jgi:short subunit dehydrogenase-like uncharacterized protein